MTTEQEFKQRIANKDPRYAELWRLSTTATTSSIHHGPPAECTLRGRELTGPEREAAGLDHGRRWALCLHPEKPLGQHVCPCMGCGPNCRGYDDGSPPPPPPRRHCLMHLLPVAGNGVWQRSLAQLNARRGLFDGRIVVAVATGSAKLPLNSPHAVRDFAPWADVIEVRNDPGRREVATWGPLWERITPHLGATDVVFYCHTKGATRPVDAGNMCHRWASFMWSLCLDHWPLVETQLKSHPITGPFFKLGYGFGPGAGRWHYSGTFFWLRAADYLARRRQIAPPEAWWGVEAWPGLTYDAGEAGCIFHRGKVGQMDLYPPWYWSTILLPEYQQWMTLNPPAWPWLTAATR